MPVIRLKVLALAGLAVVTTTFHVARLLGTPTDQGESRLGVESVAAFSDLDGDASDLDGQVNGVLSLQSLELDEGGTIIIDVPAAEFNVIEGVTLNGHSGIRTANDAPPEFGPQLTIRCGGLVSVSGTSKLSVNGASAGGRLIVCAAGGIELRGNARVTADGVGPGGRSDDDDHVSLESPGGDVWMQSLGRIQVLESSRISTSGADGGNVRLESCDPSVSAVKIRGTIRAIGEPGVGGSVDVAARRGGIEFHQEYDFVSGAMLNESPAIEAIGSIADGVITLTAGTPVVPNPPPTDPAAIVTENEPSAAGCEDCFLDDSVDCDHDGIPNTQELDECGSDPSCDDCNLNDVPDGCDIAQGDSVDADPPDSVPDECFGFIAGGCVPLNDHWSCFDNWALPREMYPDDLLSAANIHVTLDGGDSVFLDVDALIPTLRLLPGAFLQVTQAGTVGNLSFSLPARVVNHGAMVVSGNRTIGIENGSPPLFTIGPNGFYSKDPNGDRSSAGSGTSAGLAVADLIIEAGQCDPPAANGGVLQLDDLMTLDATGDIFLGGADVAECAVGTTDLMGRGGVSPPPKLNLGGTSSTRLGVSVIDSASGDPEPARMGTSRGSLHLERIVDVSVRSSHPMRLSGDFDNRSTSPATFDWLFGALSIEGSTPQSFEVAGRDVGPTLDGFGSADDSNFSMGKVQIGPGANVVFVNAFANTIGAGPCEEALYVRELELDPGAQVTLDHCRVYYSLGSTASVNVNLLGCAELVHVAPAPSSPMAPSPMNATPKNRYVSFDPHNSALPVSFQVAHAASGKTQWITPPLTELEATNFVARLAGDGTLATMPAPRVWTEPVIHATGCLIAPANSYEVRATTDGVNFTAPLAIHTIAKPGEKYWADTNGPAVGGAFSSPNGLVDFIDINAAVLHFQKASSAPPLTWMDLHPQTVDLVVNFADVCGIVLGFQGKTYPFLNPGVCP